MRAMISSLGGQLKWVFGPSMIRPGFPSSDHGIQDPSVTLALLLAALVIPGGLLLALGGWIVRRAHHPSLPSSGTVQTELGRR